MKKSILSLFFLFFIYSLSISSPILVEPPTNSDMVSLTPTLQWSDPNATYFIINVSTQSNFATTININNNSPVTADQFSISANILQPFTTYYWSVTSYYVSDPPTTSDVFSFTTIGDPDQELGHLIDIVNGMESSNSITSNQGNILIYRLQQATHQYDMNHPFLAILNLYLFKIRVGILQISNMLDEPDAQILQTHADGIINLINNGNSILPPITNMSAHSFDLMQNYPNPFNPTTDIEYTIPARNHVTLKIYDMLGKEVSTLVDKEQDAGTYIVRWNAKNFSSGIYFYRLTAGNFIGTKRMVLNK